MPITVSACMIVKDELETLPACLRSIVGHVDEIVIVDTGSTDGTQFLVKAWEKGLNNGTKIVTDEFVEKEFNFSNARNHSIQKATGDWVFIVDADDRVNVDDWDSILKTLKSQSDMVADYDMIACTIQNVYGQKATIEGSFVQPRFFRRSSGPVYKGKVHNNITFPGLDRPVNAIRSEFQIFHTGYGMLTKEALSNKTDRVLGMTKEQVDKNPEDAYGWYNYANALKSSLANKEADDPEVFKKAFAALDNSMKYAKSNNNHTFINAVTLKGWLHYVNKEYEKADHCAGTALREKPDHVDALLLRGFCNADADKLDTAEYWLKRYLAEHEKIQTIGKYDYVTCEYMGYKSEAYRVLSAIELRRKDTVDRRRALQMM